MTPRTLPREPWRGSMICGWQNGSCREYCAERKADRLPMCEEHFMAIMDEYGHVHMTPGNALGERHIRVRLLWEGESPDVPVEASAEEITRYRAILDPVRGE